MQHQRREAPVALINVARALGAIALLSGAASAFAQAPDSAAGPPSQATEAKLVFDREIFSYQGSPRRDPFKPLVGKESLGPLFEDLKLKGIIYASDPARSIALVEDGAKRMYRMRRGDIVGNSRLVDVTPLAVRFAVENFGNIRYQVLELRAGGANAGGMTTGESSPVPATQPIGNVDFSKLDQATAKRMLDSLAKARREKQGAPR